MNKIFSTLLLILICHTAQSQNLVVGANAGGNYSRFKFTEDLDSDFPDTKFIPGLNGGLRVGYNFTPSFGVYSGVEYFQKGSNYSSGNYTVELPDGTLVAGYSEWEESSSFINIPLLARWQSGGEDSGFTLTAGFSFNFGINGKIIQRFESPQLQSTLTLYESDTEFGSSPREIYKPMQAGFVFSPGYMFPLGDRGRLTINLGFDLGVGDSFNPKWKEFTDIIGNQSNRSVFLSLGYEYHFEAGGDVY